MPLLRERPYTVNATDDNSTGRNARYAFAALHRCAARAEDALVFACTMQQAGLDEDRSPMYAEKGGAAVTHQPGHLQEEGTRTKAQALVEVDAYIADIEAAVAMLKRARAYAGGQ